MSSVKEALQWGADLRDFGAEERLLRRMRDEAVQRRNQAARDREQVLAAAYERREEQVLQAKRENYKRHQHVGERVRLEDAHEGLRRQKAVQQQHVRAQRLADERRAQELERARHRLEQQQANARVSLPSSQ